MARYFRNRRAREWKAMAKAHGFKIVNTNDGDDEVWGKDSKVGIIILIPSRDNEEIILPTALSMVRKFEQLGVRRKAILSWWKENSYGE